MILALWDVDVFRRMNLKAVPNCDPRRCGFPQEQCWVHDKNSKNCTEAKRGGTLKDVMCVEFVVELESLRVVVL